MRRRARCLHHLVALLLLAAGCRKQPPAAPEDEGCFGARCVEEAEAALYYGDPASAREPLAIVCDGGDAFACFRLAELHHYGRGGPVDVPRAAQLYEQSCTVDAGEGCERRSELARDGHGGPAVELDFALRACEAQRPLACTRAGEQLAVGRGVEGDPTRATKLYEQACRMGEVTGCTGAGDLLSTASDTPETRIRALAAFVSACVGHSGYGCLRVGVAFHEGLGTDRDLDKARAHFTRACEFNDQDGCHAAEQLAAANGKPIALELTTAAAELGSDGLEVRGLSCRMSQQGRPALGEVLAGVARSKPALDACAAEGAAVAVTWEFARGRVREARVKDPGSPRLANCVVAALRKAKVPTVGACEAVLLLGDPDGAKKALAARPTTKPGEVHVRVSADD